MFLELDTSVAARVKFCPLGFCIHDITNSEHKICSLTNVWLEKFSSGIQREG